MQSIREFVTPCGSWQVPAWVVFSSRADKMWFPEKSGSFLYRKIKRNRLEKPKALHMLSLTRGDLAAYIRNEPNYFRVRGKRKHRREAGYQVGTGKEGNKLKITSASP